MIVGKLIIVTVDNLNEIPSHLRNFTSVGMFLPELVKPFLTVYSFDLTTYNTFYIDIHFLISFLCFSVHLISNIRNTYMIVKCFLIYFYFTENNVCRA